jgi:CubicO group peptidase (beta-lactamase class C family)
MGQQPTTVLQQLHDEFAARIAEAAERLKVPGVAAGLLLDGEDDYVYHGVTSITQPLPVDETTLFQIGSTTKTYTGTAIMMLVEQGLIDLDATVRTYLPNFKLKDESVAASVTVLQLLNHTAGWAGDVEIDTGYGDDALARYVEGLADVNQEAPLGERVSYNNAALCVAGRVIEVVTGKTYEQAIREMIFEPLGLHEHFYFPWEIMTRRFAAGHALMRGELQVTPWYEARAGHPPGAEHAASVRDQLRWARFHLGDGEGLLRPETLKQMQTLTTPQGSGQRGGMFGITWMLYEIDGVGIVAHGGSCRGHQSAFEMVPERNFALAIQTNARHGLELMTEIENWIREAYLGVAEQVPDPLSLSAAELAEYTGVYESHTGALHVSVEGNHLLGRLEINPELGIPPEEAEATVPPIPFVILPDDRFLITDGMYSGLQGGIIRNEAGCITAIDLGRIMTKRDA